MPEILAADIDSMMVKDLKDWVIIKVVDKHNMTAERFERLKALVQQRGKEAQSTALDAEELDEKLRHIPLSPASTLSSTPGPEELVERVRAEVYNDFETLIRMGGRPSIPIQTDPGLWDPGVTDLELHVLHHWNMEICRVQDELVRWQTFRKYQQRRRQSTQCFDEYKAALDKYQEQRGVHWRLILDPEIERQTKLDEWKEYYLYEHRKLCPLERKLLKVQQLPERLQSANGALWRANHDLEVHNGLLRWIKDQLPIIEAECAATAQGKANRRTGQKRATRPRISTPRSSMRLTSAPRSALDPVSPSKIYKPLVRKTEIAPLSRECLADHEVLPRLKSPHHDTERISSLPQPNTARKRANEVAAGVSERWSPLGPTRPSRVSKKRALRKNLGRVQQSRIASGNSHTPRRTHASAVQAGEQLSTLRRSARILERVHKAQQSSK